jgi:hypothetical protein
MAPNSSANVFRLRLSLKDYLGGLEAHGVDGWVASLGGVGVRNCTSRFKTTFSGLQGAWPAPLEPPRMLISVKVTLNAV